MLPSLVFPGSEGGGGWGGVSSSPSLGLVFVNTRHLGVIAQLQTSMLDRSQIFLWTIQEK